MASLADAEGASAAARAPPASKHAVKSLVREQLSEQRLQQLGGDGIQCAVCRLVFACCYCLISCLQNMCLTAETSKVQALTTCPKIAKALNWLMFDA